MKAHSWVSSDPVPVLWAHCQLFIIQGTSLGLLGLKEEEMNFDQDSESVHSDGGIPVDLEGFLGKARKGNR